MESSLSLPGHLVFCLSSLLFGESNLKDAARPTVHVYACFFLELRDQLSVEIPASHTESEEGIFPARLGDGSEHAGGRRGGGALPVSSIDNQRLDAHDRERSGARSPDYPTPHDNYVR